MSILIDCVIHNLIQNSLIKEAKELTTEIIFIGSISLTSCIEIHFQVGREFVLYRIIRNAEPIPYEDLSLVLKFLILNKLERIL